MSDEVLVDIEDGFMIATINRPEAKNAANKAVADQMAAAMDRLDEDPDLRAGIITGAGGTFCAGMDIKALMKGEWALVEGRGFAGVAERPPKKPLIAAIEGFALAGGCELMLACDLVVAAEDARIGLSEVRRGLCAGGGGLIRLPEQMPFRLAMELILTGEPIDGIRAAELGLINRAVPKGTALEAAKELARLVARNAPLALMASKQVMNEQADWSRDERFRKQEQIIGSVFSTEDAAEGQLAFAEKRDPVWKCR